MGCGTSKDVEESTISDKRPNGVAKGPVTVAPCNGETTALPEDGAQETDPLAHFVPAIKEKVNAANNPSESRTKHVHKLGTVTITENPFDGLEDIDIKKEEEDMADFLASEFKALNDECEDSDLKEMRKILTEMLGIADRGSKLHPQVEGDLCVDEDVSRCVIGPSWGYYFFPHTAFHPLPSNEFWNITFDLLCFSVYPKIIYLSVIHHFGYPNGCFLVHFVDFKIVN